MNIVYLKVPSTFSHIGRAASGLRFLLGSLNDAPEEIFTIGSGCLEPAYLAHLAPRDSVLHAVDVSDSIIGLLEKLVRGEKIFLAEYANTICNRNDDGSPDPNTDLTDDTILKIGLEELRAAGLDPSGFYQDGNYMLPPGGANILPVLAEASEYACANPGRFDMVYAGNVLINIMRADNNLGESIRKTRTFLDSLLPGGVFGECSPPSGIYKDGSVIEVIEEAGGKVTDIYLDNLVISDRKSGSLRGGYITRAVRRSESQGAAIDESKVAESGIEQSLEACPMFKGVSIKKDEFEDKRAASHIKGLKDELLLAMKSTPGGYVLWKAAKEELIHNIPCVRTSTGILGAVSYRQR